MYGDSFFVPAMSSLSTLTPEPAPTLPGTSKPGKTAKTRKPRARRWELDALRGLMLVLMLSTHLPTQYSVPFGQPFGFVSAAEGFVALSAYMAGMIYTQRSQREGLAAMHHAFFRRALVVYSCQAACLLFLFSVIAFLGVTLEQHAVSDLMWFYLQEPVTAFWSSLLLIYNPPLLDILPLYVIFMLISPAVLVYGLKRGWTGILVVSGALWFLSLFGLSRWVYDLTYAITGLTVPYKETGAFETFSWQLLWIFGLWMGARHACVPREQRGSFPKWVVWGSIAVVATFFVWRHITGQSPFADGNPINYLFDKWHLGPFRLLDFFAMVVLLIHFEAWLKKYIPRPHWLETMGAASLPVFCAHLVIVLLALALVGASTPERPAWIDPALYVVSIVILYWVARAVLAFEAYEAERKKRATQQPLG